MPSKKRQLAIFHLMSEAVPFAKTGGLADVGGALPPAQAAQGARVRVFVPFYRAVRKGGHDLEPAGIEVPVEIDGRITGARLWRCRRGGVEYLFVDQEEFFDRASLYNEGGRDYPDNILRFGFFCRAVAEVILSQGWEVDLFHCHDWQTALFPVYLATVYREREALRRAAVIFTIHNLAYQGLDDFTVLPRLHLPPELDDPTQMEFYGRFNLMKGGLRYSDYITTVSRTYAREILTVTHGSGQEGVLRQRANRIVGILNGIDLEVWSPEGDDSIPYPYGVDTLERKVRCTAALRREMGLEDRPDRPLVAFICRMVEQKGIHIILQAIDSMVRRNVQVVFLGQGDPRFEEQLEAARERHPGVVGGVIGYTEPLAHRVTAGADIFLMPSRFEPCGLNQQYALRYGAVPLVHRTGGLADTVIPATPRNLASGRATGFAFRRYAAKDLLWALDRALELWADKATWRQLMVRGMTRDMSWKRAARKYLALYRHAVEEARKGPRPGLTEPAPGRRPMRWGPGIWMDWGPPLPSRYERPALVLMVQGPVVLYAWWEVPVEFRVQAGGLHEGRYEDLVLILEEFNTGKRKFRKAGSDLGDSWILVHPGTRYRAHLALRNEHGDLRIVLSSRVVRTPVARLAGAETPPAPPPAPEEEALVDADQPGGPRIDLAMEHLEAPAVEPKVPPAEGGQRWIVRAAEQVGRPPLAGGEVPPPGDAAPFSPLEPGAGPASEEAGPGPSSQETGAGPSSPASDPGPSSLEGAPGPSSAETDPASPDRPRRRRDGTYEPPSSGGERRMPWDVGGWESVDDE